MGVLAASTTRGSARPSIRRIGPFAAGRLVSVGLPRQAPEFLSIKKLPDLHMPRLLADLVRDLNSNSAFRDEFRGQKCRAQLSTTIGIEAHAEEAVLVRSVGFNAEPSESFRQPRRQVDEDPATLWQLSTGLEGEHAARVKCPSDHERERETGRVG
jgi:hypothetical protein